MINQYDADTVHILLMGDTGTGDNYQYLVSKAAQEVRAYTLSMGHLYTRIPHP